MREDLTFELDSLYGQQFLTVEGLGREWVVKSVRYRNENVTGLPVEYKSSADPDDLQIVLTLARRQGHRSRRRRERKAREGRQGDALSG